MATVLQIYYEIEKCYERIFTCSTTAGRKNNYDKIVILLNDYPEMTKYWKLESQATQYVNRVKKITTPPKVDKKLNGISIFEKRTELAYIVELVEEGMIKVGKTNNFTARAKQLEKQYGKINLLHSFAFDNAEDAFLMEVLLHKYYKKKYEGAIFIPQDRFANVGLTKNDIFVLEETAKEIGQKKWF